MRARSSGACSTSSSSVARRWGEKILNKEQVPLHARVLYGLGELLVYGPLKNRFGLSRIRVAYTAGEAIGPEIFRFFRALGINLKQLYGATEASVYITAQPDGEIYADTVGKPNIDVEVKVADNGEVMYRSPGVFQGYYKDPERTARDQDAGRLGAVRAMPASSTRRAGHLKIIDRAKDVGTPQRRHAVRAEIHREQAQVLSQHQGGGGARRQRDFVCVMVNIDMTAVGSWAERNNVVYGSYQELAANPQVYDMIERHIEEVNRSLAEEGVMGSAQIRRFLVLHKELDADDGELTRTLKVRRGFIAERYAPLIEGALRRLDGSRHRDRGDVRGRPQGRHLRRAWRSATSSRSPLPAHGAGRMRAPSGARIAAGEIPALGRERVALVRRREGAARRLVRHPQGRDPRHHRPERRRQDLDAQRRSTASITRSRAASRSRARRARRCGRSRRRAAGSPARSRTSRCSRA